MRKLLIYSFIIIGAGFYFSSCKKDKTAAIYMGYDYFPTNIGHWVIYTVDSVVANPLDTGSGGYHVDSSHYEVKEIIDSQYTDNTGTRTEVISRYKRNFSPGDTNWKYQKTYTANLNSKEAIRKEDNVVYVKLAFPFMANGSYTTWDGGAFNSGEFSGGSQLNWSEANCQYTTTNAGASINWYYFDSTLTVLRCNNQNLTANQYVVEQYATGVGLIYKKIVDLQATTIIGYDPNNGFQDSLVVPADYIYLAKSNELIQGSILNYTETYSSSGN